MGGWSGLAGETMSDGNLILLGEKIIVFHNVVGGLCWWFTIVGKAFKR